MLESPKSPLEEEVFPYVATSLYGGGQDTVRLSLPIWAGTHYFYTRSAQPLEHTS